MKKMNRLIGVCVGISILLGGFWWYRHVAVVTDSQTGVSHRLTVVTSFYPIYFVTKELAGALADVSVITPAGAEPHDYEPTFQDMGRIEQSDLLIVHGALEPWAPKVLASLQGKKSPGVVQISTGLLTQDMHEEGMVIRDPHIWLSPKRMEIIVHTIADQLVRVDAPHADEFRAHEVQLIAKLRALDASLRSGLAQCTRHEIITSHAAFGYLASDYGLTQVPIAGLSPDAEPSPQDLIAVTDFARAHKVTHIFFESLVSPKLSDTIARTIGAKTLVLNPLEGLTVGEQEAGTNYFTEMQKNLQNLRTALGCI